MVEHLAASNQLVQIACKVPLGPGCCKGLSLVLLWVHSSMRSKDWSHLPCTGLHTVAASVSGTAASAVVAAVQ